jgi:hypothetical protein
MKNDNFKEEMNLINTPQFPGQQISGKSIEEIRSIIKRQKRLRGYQFICPVGSSEFNLNLSGTARILLGIAFIGLPQEQGATYDSFGNFVQVTQCQFTVNNEIVIDQLDPNFLTSYINNNEYYYIPRPLSGTDQLTMKFINTGSKAETVNMVLYYI